MLNRRLSLLILCFVSFLPTLYSQAPEGINYQAVARDANGDIMVSQAISVRLTILENSPTGTIVYQETHATSTNDFGLFTAVIGEGVTVIGTFANIDWGSDDHFLQVEADIGSGIIDLGTTQLMSVPYALYAKEVAGGGGSGDDWGTQVVQTDGTLSGDGTSGNELGLAQQGAANGEVLTWNGSQWVPATPSGGSGHWQRNGNYVFNLNDSIGIGVSQPVAKLQVDGGGDVLFGDETSERMMWIADKGALRAGLASNASWDPDSIGNKSVAFGQNTKATNDFATAFGTNTTASGSYATAMGFNTMASQQSATAMGHQTTASGFQSTAMGRSTLAEGQYSTATGHSTSATGNYSITMGRNSEASGDNATAMGISTLASGQHSTATGHSTSATGSFSITMGRNSVASGNYAAAMGFNTIASGTSSLAMGDSSSAEGSSSVAIGLNTNAIGNHSIALGYDAEATELSATAIGRNTSASGRYATSLGNGTIASGNFSLATGRNSIASGSQSTAMGNETEASGINSIAMGNSTMASGDNATAMGFNTEASENYTTAMGNSSIASGSNSTAMGFETEASGTNSIAMGNGTLASGDNATAMGYNTEASENYTTAMGFSSTANKSHAIAIGRNVLASGETAVALGEGPIASGDYSLATGRNTWAAGSRSTAMGENTYASGRYSTAMGQSTTAESGYETVIGRFNTDYSPSSTTGWNSPDRLFVIGNGTSASTKSDALVVLKNGNIGIGTSTPVASLHLQLQGTALTDAIRMTSSINSSANWSLSMNPKDDFVIRDGGQTTLIIKDSTKYVGIGTTTPDNPLEVYGDVQTNNNAVIYAEHTSSSANSASAVMGLNPGGGVGGRFRGGTGVIAEAYNHILNYGLEASAEGPGSGVAGTEARAIDAFAGNAEVGYGIKVEAFGNGLVNYGIYSTAQIPAPGVTSAAGYFNGDLTYTGTLSGPSDRKFKDEIEPLEGTLDKVRQIETYSYNYKETEGMNFSKGRQMGFIAQELEEVFPELVKDEVNAVPGDRESEEEPLIINYKGINYLGMIPVLTEAIKEQQEIIEDQQAQLEALEQRLSDLESK